jgi:hypothetical protein
MYVNQRTLFAVDRQRKRIVRRMKNVVLRVNMRRLFNFHIIIEMKIETSALTSSTSKVFDADQS